MKMSVTSLEARKTASRAGWSPGSHRHIIFEVNCNKLDLFCRFSVGAKEAEKIKNI